MSFVVCLYFEVYTIQRGLCVLLVQTEEGMLEP